MRKLILLALIFLNSSSWMAQDIFGKWLTISERTGEKKAVIEVYEENGKAYGRVIELFRTPEREQDPLCHQCKGVDAGVKVIGMDMIKGLEKDGDVWKNGEVVDFKNGKYYDCKVWRDGDHLMVRGYVSMFYRTQKWVPYAGH